MFGAPLWRQFLSAIDHPYFWAWLWPSNAIEIKMFNYIGKIGLIFDQIKSVYKQNNTNLKLALPDFLEFWEFHLSDIISYFSSNLKNHKKYTFSPFKESLSIHEVGTTQPIHKKGQIYKCPYFEKYSDSGKILWQSCFYHD